jgi:transitional endoplasmic reticulum ATPase
VLGLPDEAGRLAILKLYTARMPTLDVSLDEIARTTDGLSPADLRSLTQEAALVAMARSGPAGSDGTSTAGVTQADFEAARERIRPTQGSPTQSYTS